MTIRRWLGVWLVTLIGGTALELNRVTRNLRLDDSVGQPDGDAVWSELAGTLPLIYGGVSLFFGAFLLLGVPGKLGQRMVRRAAHAEHDVVVRGFWNFAASQQWKAPLSQVSGLSAATTVMRATREGIQLSAGFFAQTLRFRFDWDQVVDMTVVHVDKAKGVVPGPGISIRLKDFEKPLVFSVITDKFPWFAIGSLRFTEATVAELWRLLDTARPN